MTPAPLASFQASSTRAAKVLVILRGAFILDVGVKLMETLGQRGKCRRPFSGAVRLQVPAESRVQLMHRCLPTGKDKQPCSAAYLCLTDALTKEKKNIYIPGWCLRWKNSLPHKF